MTQDQPLVARLMALADRYVEESELVAHGLSSARAALEAALQSALAQPERDRNAAARATLEALGYSWHGGERWKPPLGTPPKFAPAAQPAPTKTYCCYGKYADAGHDDDCPTKTKAASTERSFDDWWMLQSKLPYRDKEEIARMAFAAGQASKPAPTEQTQPVVGETWLVKHKGASALTTMTFAQVTPNTVQLQADYWQADGMRYAKADLEFVERLATPPTAQPAESERKTS
jgi:hypothetical protein